MGNEERPKKLEVFISNDSTGECLGADKAGNILYWEQCSNTSIWIAAAFKDDLIKIKHKLSDKCMDVQKIKSENIVVLTNCSVSDYKRFDIVPMAQFSTQLATYTATINLLYRGENLILCSGCGDELSNLAFDPIEEYEEPCRKDMEIENGAVMTNASAPFFLPGTAITIACHSGYEYQNTTTYTFTCINDFIRLPSCHRSADFGHDFSPNIAAKTECGFGLSVFLLQTILF